MEEISTQWFGRFFVVFSAFMCSMPAVLSYTFRPHKLWRVLSIALPILLFTIGIISQNIIILFLGISCLSTLITSWLHREHVIKLSNAGDSAVALGWIAFVFLGLEIGNLSKEFLLQMYSGIFQACLATLGIVFAVAAFSSETTQRSNTGALKPILYGLGEYLALIAITALIGMLYSNNEFSFGYSVFILSGFPIISNTSSILNLQALQALIFFFNLVMVFSLVGYIIVLLRIILVVRTKK